MSAETRPEWGDINEYLDANSPVDLAPRLARRSCGFCDCTLEPYWDTIVTINGDIYCDRCEPLIRLNVEADTTAAERARRNLHIGTVAMLCLAAITVAAVTYRFIVTY